MPAEKSLLRLLSCGSVDDGKSTLIGRILYDCGMLYEDQLALLEKERTLENLPNFSALLDGLPAEREQAITIDLVYRTFFTATRRYLVADAPGHEQYTRNMVAEASRADAALLLIDSVQARSGLLPQTLRHTMVAALMGIPHMVVAVNKMDGRGYEQAAFTAIEKEYLERIAGLRFASLHCVPVSALRGDNVCRLSRATPWYQGPTLLEILESLEPARPVRGSFRLPVQWVAKVPECRGHAGTILSGAVAVGQKALSSSGLTDLAGGRQEAGVKEAVCLQLPEDLDVGRGEVLSDADDRPEIGNHLAARMIWFDEVPLVPGRTYLFRQAAASARATVTEIAAKISLETLREVPAKELRENDAGTIKLRLDSKLALAPYAESRDLGGFILIDPSTASTLGAGLIQFILRRSHNIHPRNFTLDAKAQALQKGQTPRVLWFLGLSASGKSTLAESVAKALYAQGRHVYILDGDNLRDGLNQDLGFSEAARAENIRRAAEVAKFMTEAGLIVLASFISPYRRDRQAARALFPIGSFLEIFVDTPLSVCVARDPKGLYAQALDGHLPNFTGISAPFEAPEHPALHLDGQADLDDLTQTVLDFLEGLDTK